MKIHKLIQACVISAAALATCAIAVHAAEQFMVVPGPSDLTWADTGPLFPNTQIVIVDGDPGNPGPVTLRFRCPAGYKFFPHTHPGPERVTVLTGTMLVAIGSNYDASKLKAVQVGGYFVIPTEAPHYGECRGDTIIEVHTTGPLGTTYVNASEDPSKK
jgi:quercetin dioxygenase-like cupin family protein